MQKGDPDCGHNRGMRMAGAERLDAEKEYNDLWWGEERKVESGMTSSHLVGGINMQELKSSVDLNASLLQSIYRTVTELQLLLFNQDKRLLSIEGTLHNVASSSSSAVTSPMPVYEVKDDEPTESGANCPANEIAPMSGEFSRQLKQDDIDDMKELLLDVKRSIQVEIKESNTDLKSCVRDSMKKSDASNLEVQRSMTSSMDDVTATTKQLSDSVIENQTTNSSILERLTNVAVLSNTQVIEGLGLINVAVQNSTDKIKAHINCRQDLLENSLNENFTQVGDLFNNKLGVFDSKEDTLLERCQAFTDQIASINVAVQHSTDDIKSHINCRTDLVNSQTTDLLENSLNERSIQQEVFINNKFNTVFDVKGDFYKLIEQGSRAILDQIAAESLNTRDILLRRKVHRNIYTCDFHIVNFELWEGSGRTQYSRLWYIDQAETFVKAAAWFTHDNKLEMSLVHGRHPREVGMEAEANVDLEVKAMIVQEPGGKSWELETTVEFGVDEERIIDPCDGWVMPRQIAQFTPISCSGYLKRNFIYAKKLLVRFDITALSAN